MLLTDRSRYAECLRVSGRPKEFERNAVLVKAMDLFWRKGYDGASLADLVDAMGVGRQSAYDTFGDKHELFRQALDAYAARSAGMLTTILTEGPSPLGRIRRFLTTLNEIASAGDARGCLFTNSMVELGPHDARVRKTIAGIWQELEDALAANVQSAADAGEVRAALDPRGTARLLLTVMQGALVLTKAKLPDHVADATRTMEELILR
jgi:TetR/AcrR family transcriptional repressor of nem operon